MPKKAGPPKESLWEKVRSNLYALYTKLFTRKLL